MGYYDDWALSARGNLYKRRGNCVAVRGVAPADWWLVIRDGVLVERGKGGAAEAEWALEYPMGGMDDKRCPQCGSAAVDPAYPDKMCYECKYEAI